MDKSLVLSREDLDLILDMLEETGSEDNDEGQFDLRERLAAYLEGATSADLTRQP